MHPDTSDTPASDLLVIGSGVAGLSAALAAAEEDARVTLITGGALLSGSSPHAQGGIAAAIGADDRPALHAADTLAVGAGLNSAQAVHVLVHAGRLAVQELLATGVPFDGGPHGPDLGLEAGHARRRILHAGGEATGRALTMALLARVVEHPCVRVRTHSAADELLTADGRVAGVRSGETRYHARGVVLATGGYAALWGRTTNSGESRGTGLSLAWQAGAALADLEFVQFHPTALSLPGYPALLLSEALRGEGALLVDGHERPIIDPLLPRDVVARGIARHLRESGPVYLSLRHLDAESVHRRFPNITARLTGRGLDLARDLLPVAPAAHYCMGGIRTDNDGRTTVPGLYAAGEAACTGAQGANRLASNSLLECLVFGRRAALAALHDEKQRHAAWHTGLLPASGDGLPGTDAPGASLAGATLGPLLDRYLGVERDANGLATLAAALPDPAGDAVSGPSLIAALAARAALLRAESRGAHERSDAPRTRPGWRGRIHWRRGLPPQFERIDA